MGKIVAFSHIFMTYEVNITVEINNKKKQPCDHLSFPKINCEALWFKATTKKNMQDLALWIPDDRFSFGFVPQPDKTWVKMARHPNNSTCSLANTWTAG